MRRKTLLSLFALIAVFGLLAFTPEAKAAVYPDRPRSLSLFTFESPGRAWTLSSAWSPNSSMMRES